MAIKVEIIHGWTRDWLKLQWMHRESKKNSTCLVFVHWMAWNILENYFAEILWFNLSSNWYWFIYWHNRWYSIMNDIEKNEIWWKLWDSHVRIWVTYERFHECINDIELWVYEAKKMWYKNIILVWFSLWCNKTIHYLNHIKCKNIFKLILIWPPDMVWLAKKEWNKYEKFLMEAKINIKYNSPKKLLSGFWENYPISSQTFLDLFQEFWPADNLPISRNPEIYKQLSSINVPILAIMWENDSVIINSPYNDLNTIKDKSLNCESFDMRIIEWANHIYSNREQDLSNSVLERLDS